MNLFDKINSKVVEQHYEKNKDIDYQNYEKNEDYETENRISQIIKTVAKATLYLGGFCSVILLFQSLILTITLIFSTVISYILFISLAEIIQLLQDIKDK